MHAPYAAQYCVIGGSGAGSGGSFTPDAAPAADAVSEAPLSASVADAGVAGAVVALAAIAVVAVVELAVFVPAAVVE